MRYKSIKLIKRNLKLMRSVDLDKLFGSIRCDDTEVDSFEMGISRINIKLFDLNMNTGDKMNGISLWMCVLDLILTKEFVRISSAGIFHKMNRIMSLRQIESISHRNSSQSRTFLWYFHCLNYAMPSESSIFAIFNWCLIFKSARINGTSIQNPHITKRKEKHHFSMHKMLLFSSYLLIY